MALVISSHAARYAQGLTEKFSDKGWEFSVIPGRKYDKIVESHNNNSRSVHAFVDVDGNVYKAAGWSAPAKGVRFTNVEDAIKASDPYGSYLYR